MAGMPPTSFPGLRKVARDVTLVVVAFWGTMFTLVIWAVFG